jgi:hypothetical protein
MVPQGHWHYFCLLPPLHFAATIIFDKLIFCVNRRALVESCNFQDVFIIYLNFAALFELPRSLKYLVSDSFSFALSLSFNFKIASVASYRIWNIQICLLIRAVVLFTSYWGFTLDFLRASAASYYTFMKLFNIFQGRFLFSGNSPAFRYKFLWGNATKSSQARFNCPSCNWRLNWRECVSNM